MHRHLQEREDDCLSGALSCLLGIPAEDVPSFSCAGGGHAQMRRLNRWLCRLGYTLVEVEWRKKQFAPSSGTYYALAIVEWGTGPYTGQHHAVVARIRGRECRIVWDPATRRCPYAPRQGDKIVSVCLITPTYRAKLCA